MIKIVNNQVSIKGDIETILNEYIQLTDGIAEILSSNSEKSKEECIRLFLEEYIDGKFGEIKCLK
ncbi:hypothetical protein CRU92_00800 [Arcobacter sp. FW59]|nr:hypothetical protein CRU92_00800 [Arcobacter sp. FW59]